MQARSAINFSSALAEKSFCFPPPKIYSRDVNGWGRLPITQCESYLSTNFTDQLIRKLTKCLFYKLFNKLSSSNWHKMQFIFVKAILSVLLSVVIFVFDMFITVAKQKQSITLIPRYDKMLDEIQNKKTVARTNNKWSYENDENGKSGCDWDPKQIFQRSNTAPSCKDKTDAAIQNSMVISLI